MEVHNVMLFSNQQPEIQDIPSTSLSISFYQSLFPFLCVFLIISLSLPLSLIPCPIHPFSNSLSLSLSLSLKCGLSSLSVSLCLSLYVPYAIPLCIYVSHAHYFKYFQVTIISVPLPLSFSLTHTNIVSVPPVSLSHKSPFHFPTNCCPPNPHLSLTCFKTLSSIPLSVLPPVLSSSSDAQMSRSPVLR